MKNALKNWPWFLGALVVGLAVGSLTGFPATLVGQQLAFPVLKGN